MEDVTKEERLIIAFSGWSTSGKSTCCKLVDDAIKEKFGGQKKCQTVHIAQFLKNEAMEKYGLTEEQVYVEKDKMICDRPVEVKDEYCIKSIIPLLNELRFDPNRTYQSETGSTSNPDFDEYTRIDIDHVVLKTSGRLYKRIVVDISYDKVVFHPMFWTPRAILIGVGSTSRMFDSYIWIKMAMREILGIESESLGGSLSTIGVASIGDLRYKNELSFISKCVEEYNRGNTWLNIRFIHVRVVRYDTHPRGSTDASEHDLDNTEADFYIDNRDSLMHSTSSQIVNIINQCFQ